MQAIKGLVTLAAVIAFAGCADKTAREVDERIADRDRPLVMLTHPTEPPHSYRDPVTGEIKGSDVELAREIAKRLGRPLDVQGVDFAKILPRLRDGTADFGVAEITITESRRQDVDFSTPYDHGGSVFLYPAEQEAPWLSRLQQVRVGVETDTIGDFFLCRHDCNPRRFANLGEALAALEQGGLDAVFFDYWPLKNHADRSGGRFRISPLVTREFYGVAVDKRRPDVLAAANAVIKERRSGR